MKHLFYRPLKINHGEREVVFWSDTHFGHRCDSWETPLWKARGFDSIEEHDAILIKRWNEQSSNSTIFFHLGDFIFGLNTIERIEHILKNVNFKTLYLMPGNHCSGWKQRFEMQPSNRWSLEGNKTVYFVPNYLEVYVNEQPIVLSHFPLASWNAQSKGAWMLHGHCHGNIYKSPIGPLLYATKIYDVGIENCAKPICYKNLKTFFSDKPNITYDHHTETTRNPF